MKKAYRYIIAGIIAMTVVGCSKDEFDPEVDTNFHSFAIQGYENAQTSVDMASHTITIQLPETVTSGNDLVPVFTVGEGAQVSINREVFQSGTKHLDFNGPVLMTVSNADYTQKQRWRINVTNNDYTTTYGMGSFLSDGCSNYTGSPDSFYFQQQHTGTYSSENCGPACAAMACKWISPSYTGTVEQARNTAIHSSVDGGTWWFPRDIWNYINVHAPRNSFGLEWWDFTGASYQGYVNTIVNKLKKEGCIAISCLNMSNVREQTVTDKGYRSDCYYKGTQGHFLLIKGYRIVDGVVWLEINDPWGLDLKYDDGTPYGASRFYRALEVASSIDWNVWTIIVTKK